MGSPDLFNALAKNLDDRGEHALVSADLRLTPYLSVVVAIMYMMAADGNIDEKEISQLQSVIGADDQALRRAVAYAQTHQVEQFLQDAPSMLDVDGRLCLLVNVADSLMADGDMQKVELQLFEQMLTAFGQTRRSFQPHFDALAAKGRMSLLGDFDAAAANEAMTPPKALVVSLLYMMSADGEMAPEEVGRLSVVTGGSQALLKKCLGYVGKVRVPQFLVVAADVLDQRQRLCVLLNACDAMMSDREVVTAERELFSRMMAAFDVPPSGLDAYIKTMQAKYEMPLDVAPRRQKSREEGQVFERKRTWEEETGEAGVKARPAQSTAPAARAAGAKDGPIDHRISKTMQDNIDRLSEGFDDGLTMERLEQHARVSGAEGDAASGKKGPSDLRKTKDGDGASKLRTAVDGKGGSDLRKTMDGDGASKLRTAVDGKGDSDLRKTKDVDGASKLRAAVDGKGDSDLRATKDGDGAGKLRTAVDGKGDSDLRATKDGDGAVELRNAVDGEGAADLRKSSDGDGAADQRTAMDAAGPLDMRTAADALAASQRQAMQDNGLINGPNNWRDAPVPGERRDIRDGEPLSSATALNDDRRSFDGDADTDADLPDSEQQIEGRMGAVRDRTDCIRDHLDALRRSGTLRAGSRLPSLPRLPFRPRVVRGAGVADASHIHTSSSGKVEDHDDMLWSAEKGVSEMSEKTEKTENTVEEEKKTNRSLRLRSAVLLPALSVTFGATMVGETMSERLFITNENLATDARIVHQMASVQQSVYRIAPESVQLAADALGPLAGDASLSAVSVAGAAIAADAQSDRQKADSYLEQRKQELMNKFRQHHSSSVVAAERQQWFVYAKSIVMLGIGMALWGVLYRSLRMLHGSTAAGLVGLLLTANGYWLFLRF
jgi:uncharacterized tellurite resistance protein B-like protein